MSLLVPTTQEVSDNTIAEIELAISQTIPLLPKGFTRVLAKVFAVPYLSALSLGHPLDLALGGRRLVGECENPPCDRVIHGLCLLAGSEQKGYAYDEPQHCLYLVLST